MAGLSDPVFDEMHIFFKPEEGGLVADPINSANSVPGRATSGRARTLRTFALENSADTSALLARDNPPLGLTYGLLEGGIDDLEDVSDGNAVGVLGNRDPGMKFGNKAQTSHGGIDRGLVKLRLAGVGVTGKRNLGLARAETNVPDDSLRGWLKDRAHERVGLCVKVHGLSRGLARVRVGSIAQSPRREHKLSGNMMTLGGGGDRHGRYRVCRRRVCYKS